MEINSEDNDLPYLHKLNEMNTKKNKNIENNIVPKSLDNANQTTKKLESIRNKITNYLDEKHKTKSEPKFTTRYNNPIPKTDFDKIFLNINNIKTIYISNDNDRAIFEFFTSQKYVYYLKDTKNRQLLNKIINILTQPVKIVIICDKTVMDDPFGHLYCDRY
jgi:hypothetical protein